LTVLISLEQVSRDFDNGRIVALRDVNLVVAKAESVAIVGASGSGKTTLIMLMCGIMLPSAGVIRWRGTPVTTPKAWTGLRRTEIGIVFQDFNLFPTLTAVENVEVPMLGTLNHSCERKRRANDVLEAVGLGERGYHLPHQLSGGERQRVAIARSLVNHPTLLLADEPTGNLDSISGTAIMDLLFDLQRSQGVTLVLVTHDASHARRCTQQIQIQDGRVFEKAPGRLREVAK
jgi:predicted ABC-type transport system involved in lysophospholipase L1 biosynthesis ATPase subunit